MASSTFCDADISRSYKSNYVKIKEIGRGSYGQVFLVQRKGDSGSIFAMKEEKIETQARRRRQDEMKALKSCSHPNIVQYIDDFIDDGICGYSRIVTQFCSGGDLKRFMEKGQIHFTLAYTWNLDLARGMEYLERKKIIHRDLKPENIFILSKRLKIGDFGLARCMER